MTTQILNAMRAEVRAETILKFISPSTDDSRLFDINRYAYLRFFDTSVDDAMMFEGDSLRKITASEFAMRVLSDDRDVKLGFPKRSEFDHMLIVKTVRNNLETVLQAVVDYHAYARFIGMDTTHSYFEGFELDPASGIYVVIYGS